MSKKSIEQMRPFFSIVIIVISLFAVAFLQMETRRLGYVVLKQTREYKLMQDEHRVKIMHHAKITRPDRLREVAIEKLTLSDIRSGQIIHIAGEKIAIRQ